MDAAIFRKYLGNFTPHGLQYLSYREEGLNKVVHLVFSVSSWSVSNFVSASVSLLYIYASAWLSVGLFVSLSLCLYVCLTNCLCLCLCLRLSLCLCLRLSLSPSLYLSACISPLPPCYLHSPPPSFSCELLRLESCLTEFRPSALFTFKSIPTSNI